jgi:hypothetical protein
MNTSEVPQMMTRDEFAEFMRVEPRTVDTWIARKKFADSSRVKIRGRNYFKVADALDDLGMTVEQWLSVRDRQ